MTRTLLPTRNDLERPSVRNSWRDWRGNSPRTDTWLREEDNNSRETWVWTRPKSRSGSRTRGRRSRRPMARRILSLCSWWLRVSTITRPFQSMRMARRSTTEKINSRKSRGGTRENQWNLAISPHEEREREREERWTITQRMTRLQISQMLMYKNGSRITKIGITKIRS